jgi:hypothetical protein
MKDAQGQGVSTTPSACAVNGAAASASATRREVRAMLQK